DWGHGHDRQSTRRQSQRRRSARSRRGRARAGVGRTELRARPVPREVPPRPHPSLPRAGSRRGATGAAVPRKARTAAPRALRLGPYRPRGRERDAVIQGLRDLGAFGIKIPREYGGLGLSQLSYMKAIELVSSIDGSVTALLSAHQSIGV